jgi:hypothetical protein
MQATGAAGEELFEFMALTWEWSYGDSNPRPLACHSSLLCRPAMLDVLLAGDIPSS